MRKYIIGKKGFILISLLVLVILVLIGCNPAREGTIVPSVPETGDYLFPSVKTFAYLPGDATGLPINEKEELVRFWCGHYDILIGGAPVDMIRDIKPDITQYSYSIATSSTEYNDDEGTYRFILAELKNWVDDHYLDYGFDKPEEALEDCFLHSTRDITIEFTDKSRGSQLEVNAYDPQDPIKSRVPGSWQKNNDWCMNIKSDVYKDFWFDYWALEASKDYDGFMLDVHHWPCGQIPDDGFVELFREEYQEELDSFTEELGQVLRNNSRQLGINTYRDVDGREYEYINYVDFVLREVIYSWHKECVSIEKELRMAYQAGDAGKIVLLHHGSSFNEEDRDPDLTAEEELQRDWMAGLAVYLIAQKGPVYFYTYPGTHYGGDKRETSWFEAMAVDIGKPEAPDNPGEPYTEFAKGEDPSQSGIEYKVLARKYSKALVLVKPRPYWDTQKYDASTATTHDLDGTYRPLKVDGTLGEPITSITLKNWEGAILIPVED